MTGCLLLLEGSHKKYFEEEDYICLEPWISSKERVAMKANIYHQDRELSNNAT